MRQPPRTSMKSAVPGGKAGREGNLAAAVAAATREGASPMLAVVLAIVKAVVLVVVLAVVKAVHSDTATHARSGSLRP